METYGEVTYLYNGWGERREKKFADGRAHLFRLDGNRIMKEMRGTTWLNEVYYLEFAASDTLLYTYDVQGIRMIEYRGTNAELNGKRFLVRRNLQGDVIELFGNGYVAKYAYDAWGNHKVYNADGTENTDPSFIGNINPFRYRGYYYDTESGLYYVNGRYYDPKTGRFLNADLGALNPNTPNGCNLYAYCGNSPISVKQDVVNSGGMVGSIWGGSLGASVIKNAGASLSSLSLYDALGFTSNVLAIINGIKVAQYLTHIHGNPPSVSWFIDNLYKVDKFSKFFGYVAALIDGIGVYRNTNDIGKAIFTTGYDIGGMIIASSLGGFIGSTLGILLGGPAGAIIGTLAGIGIESLIQYFKEDVVNWVDKTFDDFIYWISNKWGDLINA